MILFNQPITEFATPLNTFENAVLIPEIFVVQVAVVNQGLTFSSNHLLTPFVFHHSVNSSHFSIIDCFITPAFSNHLSLVSQGATFSSIHFLMPLFSHQLVNSIHLF